MTTCASGNTLQKVCSVCHQELCLAVAFSLAKRKKNKEERRIKRAGVGAAAAAACDAARASAGAAWPTCQLNQPRTATEWLLLRRNKLSVALQHQIGAPQVRLNLLLEVIT